MTALDRDALIRLLVARRQADVTEHVVVSPEYSAVLAEEIEAEAAWYVDAILAAQEGERGGADVAAAVEAVLTDPYAEASTWTVSRIRAALGDPDGALRQHDAEVLRAAADDEDWRGVMFNRDGLDLTPENRVRYRLRERADRIAAGEQP